MPTIEGRIGRYVLRDPVGRGAMGIVYRAEDPLILRAVAVKVLRATSAMTAQQVGIARERFRREAESAGGLDHPNIIRIYDVGEDYDTGEMYLVMELISGPSLEKVLEEGSLDVERAVEIIGQIASGLDAAHAKGIVHRDIKPSNILLTEQGTAKIVDFGITHIASSSLTQDMREVGTPAYMSPEQVNARAVDARSDLFSLGVLSYEILTGRRPFTGTDAVSVAHAIAFAEPLPISAANTRLPRALDDVMSRMLAKDPGERFTSGREFHEALLACVSGAATPGSSRRATLSTGRRLAPWGLAVMATLAAGVFFLRVNREGADPVAAESHSRESAPQAIPAPSPVPAATPASAPISMARVTISLVHRLRHGRLSVSLDGKPILTESFSKSRLTIMQTTIWEPVEAPAGKHKLRAKVTGEDGKTYLLDPCDVDLPRAKDLEFRIRFKGASLSVEEHSG